MPDPRTADLLDALLLRHAGLAAAGERGGAAMALLQRARLLAALGAADPAQADLRAARHEDPAHPAILAWSCALARGPGHPAHDLAEQLIASPFATPEERAAALEALDPDRLPRLLPQLLPGHLRVSLVLRDGDRVDCQGLGPDDQQQPLGRAEAGGARVTVLDMICARPADGSRQLRFRLNERAIALECPAIAAPPAALPPPDPARPSAPLWIVMPVCDGGAAVLRGLDALRAAMRGLPGCRLVLVDDGSQSALIRDRLRAEARRPRVQLLRTGGGAGFAGSVNLGLQAIGRGPVLLLNSDTFLPAATLPRLLAHLRDPSVGTVTPLSNNAGSLSLRGPGLAARMPSAAICTRLDRMAARLHPGAAVDLPNANGFCMLISERCLRQTGLFSRAYDSGYYEEVDFSLRASRLGHRHLAALDCVVGHVGSASFGAAKAGLVAVNRQRIHRNFPDYKIAYERFLQLDPLAFARDRLLAAIAPLWRPVPLDPAPDPRPEQVFAWGRGPGLPWLLPQNGARLAPPLRGHRFQALRPVPAAHLLAQGLRLDPGHGHWLDWAAGPQRLTLRDAQGRPVVALDCAGAGPEDLAGFETAVLAALNAEVRDALPV